MKKKLFIFITALLLVFTLVGCSKNKLPDLSGKTEDEVIEIFNKNKNFDVEYKYFYDEDAADETMFYEYENNYKAGDVVEKNEKVVVVFNFRYLKLPDFTNLNRNEMEQFFIDREIPLSMINFSARLDDDVEVGTFIRYNQFEIGDYVDLNDDLLRIYYEARIKLPDLEGLNKYEIQDLFAKLFVNLQPFEYMDDNSEEFDTFLDYGSHDVGDVVTRDESVKVFLYSNTDVSYGDYQGEEKQLFISKYIDGGSEYGKGIEIHNPTDSTINLKDYYIAILSGGKFQPSKVIELDGTLNSNGSYTIIYDGSSEDYLSKADIVTDEINFSSIDTIQLRKKSNDTYIDTIYDVGNINIIFEGEIFVRRNGITHGRRDFSASEWMGFIPSFTEVLDTHPYDGPLDPPFELMADKTFQEYGMTKVEFIRAADGDTVYFNSLDTRDKTSYDGDNRIRFLIVDTPETEKPGQVGEPYAQAAARFTRDTLNRASEIYLQASVEGKLTDTYGRHLGLIWVNIGTLEDPDWILLNYELLKLGLGRIYIAKTGNYFDHPIFGGRYLYQWAEDASNYAKDNKLGIHSGVNLP